MKIHSTTRSTRPNTRQALRWLALLASFLIVLGCSSDGGTGGTTDTASPDTASPDTAADVTEGCTTDADCVDPLADLGPCMNQSCNVDSGECETTALENGTECGAGDECVGASTCADGDCMPSDTAVDCNDSNECTTDTCDPDSGCANTAIDGCCTSDTECDDQNDCTSDVCHDTQCVHTEIADCNQGCQNAIDCDDQNACTTDTCDNGECTSTEIDGCCISADQCDDQNDCTENNCEANMCTFTVITGCCTENAQCDDQDGCTTDACENNFCTNTLIEGCSSGCQNDDECDDGNPCTFDNCDAGGCLSFDIVDCCTEKGQCNDNNSCTDDTCENNKCVNIENGTCVGPTEDTMVFCTLTGAVGDLTTCEIHMAAKSTAEVDQMVAFEIDLVYPTNKAEMTGFSCPPGDCAGLNGTLASSHFLQASENIPGKIKIISFSLPIMPLNDATYINGQMTGNTYVFTLNFKLLTGEDVPVFADEFIGSNSGASKLPVELIHFDPTLPYGVVVSGFMAIP